MPQPLRRPKDRISVLVVTADNMTSELLKNAFAHGRDGFKVETLTCSSQEIIGELIWLDLVLPDRRISLEQL